MNACDCSSLSATLLLLFLMGKGRQETACFLLSVLSLVGAGGVYTELSVLPLVADGLKAHSFLFEIDW